MRRVLHIETFDSSGGAARAVERLHLGLRLQGWDSWIVAGYLTTGQGSRTTLLAETRRNMHAPSAAIEALAPKLVRYVGEIRLPLRSSRLFPRTELFQRASIIHLHNLHGNFFDYRVLPYWGSLKPLVFTLHDMWPLTGHCAYSFGCERWRTGCHDCPLYAPDMRPLDEIYQPKVDVTRPAWRSKRETYRQVRATVVAPSRWLTEIARQSILMANPNSSVLRIPYGLDTEVYRPIDKALARELLGIPLETRVLLAGAASLRMERKGVRYVLDAMRKLGLEFDDLVLLLLGSSEGLNFDGIPTRALEHCASDHLQTIVYSSADVFVAPSLADNQPLQVLEALACGVPVVAFATGGIPEVVRHLETGYCVRTGDANELFKAIRAILSDDELGARLGDAGRQLMVREHSLALQARRYAELYEELSH